jgi:3'-phosphoadenosine 5'-phosphosulfate sulfotransferase (PAPS reductase)/FAD synthetase
MKATLFAPRILVWFSCGAASAVAAKRTIEQYGDTHDVEIIYCDTLKYEHPDNPRFLSDVSDWIGREIKIMKYHKYNDIMECFRGERFIVGNHGAPCTRLMKKQVRLDYASKLDVHVFGYTADEQKRIADSEADNPQLWCEFVLRDQGITKKDCYGILHATGIEIPVMYKLGYKNNNCIGCVKGGKGYWNKIRKDFPERFLEMAALEKEIGGRIFEDVWLSDLPPDAGRKYKQEDIECGVLCLQAEE